MICKNDFIDGVLGTPEAQVIVPKVVSKIREYNDNQNIVLFTQDTHYEDYLKTIQGKNLPIPHCIHGTDDWCINKAVRSVWMHDGAIFPAEGVESNNTILKKYILLRNITDSIGENIRQRR